MCENITQLSSNNSEPHAGAELSVLRQRQVALVTALKRMHVASRNSHVPYLPPAAGVVLVQLNAQKKFYVSRFEQ